MSTNAELRNEPNFRQTRQSRQDDPADTRRPLPAAHGPTGPCDALPSRGIGSPAGQRGARRAIFTLGAERRPRRAGEHSANPRWWAPRTEHSRTGRGVAFCGTGFPAGQPGARRAASATAAPRRNRADPPPPQSRPRHSPRSDDGPSRHMPGRVESRPPPGAALVAPQARRVAATGGIPAPARRGTLRPEGATGCSHGWNPGASRDATRGSVVLFRSRPGRGGGHRQCTLDGLWRRSATGRDTAPDGTPRPLPASRAVDPCVPAARLVV